jgi:hypothetical protein
MRNLHDFELEFVTGAGSCCSPCPPQGGRDNRRKNNNGFGNGPESGPAPGRSGTNNSPSASDKQNNRGR